MRHSAGTCAQHYMKIFCIWSFSGPYFPAFGLNTENYYENVRIQSKYGKIQTAKSTNTDTSYTGKIKSISYFPVRN